jgi:hypothetical protein
VGIVHLMLDHVTRLEEIRDRLDTMRGMQ